MSYKSQYRKLKSMGDVADAHFLLEAQIDAVKAEVKKMEADLEKYELDAIAMSGSQGNLLARGKVADGEVEERVHLNIKDPAKLGAWVQKTGHTEIFQRRVNQTAYYELVAAKKTPPGIEPFKKKVFKTKKRGGKKPKV